jgi:MacB-like periplasmic core domain
MIPSFRKLGWLRRRRNKEDELREELQFHLEEEAEERRAAGFTEADAQRAAHRDLGNITLLKENVRDMWGWTFLEQLAQDLCYALRTMKKNLAFSALAVLSLALGIGANTAIYSFMDALLLRSLPVRDPRSLVVLNWHDKLTRVPVMHAMSGSTYDDFKTGSTGGIFPFPAFELFQRNSGQVLSSVFAYYPANRLNIMVKGQSEVSHGEYVSGDYFRGLEVRPAGGRLILSDDDRVGAPAVVVVSMRLCRGRFGSADNAMGQTILINNIPFAVIGVAPEEFFGSILAPLQTSISRCTPIFCWMQLRHGLRLLKLTSVRTTTGSK